MSIVEVVEHLYHFEKDPDGITVTFLTSRRPWYVPFFVLVAIFVILLWSAFHFRWPEGVTSALVGGSVGMIGTAYAMISGSLTRYSISIRSDVVVFQKELAAIPVGRARIFPRSDVTDLGIYPHTYRRSRQHLPRFGRLSVWIHRKSLEIENFFPITEGLALARDLEREGIIFERTQEAYDESRLIEADDYTHLTF